MSTKKSFAGFEQKIAVVKGDMKLSKSGDAILLTKLERCSSSSRLQHFCLQKRKSNTSIHRKKGLESLDKAAAWGRSYKIISQPRLEGFFFLSNLVTFGYRPAMKVLNLLKSFYACIIGEYCL